MRTTLVIPDPVFRRAKAAARRDGRNLSELFTEAVTMKLQADEALAAKRAAPFRLVPVSMGKPLVDVSNREELQRALDGD